MVLLIGAAISIGISHRHSLSSRFVVVFSFSDTYEASSSGQSNDSRIVAILACRSLEDSWGQLTQRHGSSGEALLN